MRHGPIYKVSVRRWSSIDLSIQVTTVIFVYFDVVTFGEVLDDRVV